MAWTESLTVNKALLLSRNREFLANVYPWLLVLAYGTLATMSYLQMWQPEEHSSVDNILFPLNLFFLYPVASIPNSPWERERGKTVEGKGTETPSFVIELQ